MKLQIDNNFIFVTLAPGEAIMETLTAVARENNLKSGWISGIGAITGAEIGMFNISEKKYRKNVFSGEYELVNLQGNISIKDGDPFVHAHVVFSDEKYQTFSGHLFESTISAAGEFVIHAGSKTVNRKMNENVGLPLWCFDSNDE